MRSVARGFTLVELLVVIAIIGILIGMMVPGLLGVREAAHRTSCLGNMAHLGTALTQYETAHGALPPGVTDPGRPIRNVAAGTHISWVVPLLPYLEEGGTAKAIDQAAGAYGAKNAAVRTVRITALLCPSDFSESRGNPLGVSHYAGCHHDVEAPIDTDNHGVLFLNSHISRRDVTDGPMHTIYLGEKVAGRCDLGWLSGTRATLRNTGTTINGTPELDCGPNIPAAKRKAVELRVGGFGSRHPLGANFLFGDGQVRFVNQTIDSGILRQLGHRADGKLLTSGPTRGE
jgi:prepilin-type N-terminal cleavage/methylation domain-containing protein/prepilin-type processing-associated H-X9-DG protein